MFIFLFSFLLQANNCSELFITSPTKAHNILIYRTSPEKAVSELIAKTSEPGIKRVEVENPFSASRKANAFAASYLSNLASKGVKVDIWIDRNIYSAEKHLINFLDASIPEITFYVSRQSHTLNIRTYRDSSRETLVASGSSYRLVRENFNSFLEIPLIQYLNRQSLSYLRENGLPISNRRIVWEDYIAYATSN